MPTEEPLSTGSQPEASEAGRPQKGTPIEFLIQGSRDPESIVLSAERVRLRRLAEAGPETQEPSRRGPFRSPAVWWLAAVLLAGAAFTVFFAFRTGSVLKDNLSLGAQTTQLRLRLEALETENKDLSARIQAAEQDKERVQDALANLKKERETLEFELKKTQERLTAATEEKVYLEEILINKTKENEALRSGLPSGAAPIAASGPLDAAQDLDGRLRQRDVEIRRLTEQNRELAERIKRLHQTMNQKMSEINVAKIALEETIADARGVIENEIGAVDLGSILVAPAGTTAAAVSSEPAAQTPRKIARKEGKVLAINEEHGFIVVDLGKVDGVRPDSLLTLKKNGQTVATLSVLEVRDVMTACNLKTSAGGQKIEINDPVSIQK